MNIFTYIYKYLKFSYIGWDKFLNHHKLNSPDFEKFIDKLDWKEVSIFQQLTSKDLEKYADKLDWYYVSMFQKLTSKDLEKFIDKLDWYRVSKYQKLTSEDLEKFIDKLNWKYVSIHQKLTSKDLEKFKDKINLAKQERHHKEKSLEEKRQEVAAYAAKYNLKFDGEVLHAFREHDQYGRGTWNGTLSYEKGNYYQDWRCDMDSKNENSFGLGIWPKGNTKITVSVKDWGTAVFEEPNGKARVFGFTVK